MDFDVPPASCRILTIVEAPSGMAWVHFWPNAGISIGHRDPHTDDYVMTATVGGFARSVVAASVADAMRVATEHWAEKPTNRRELRG